MSQSAAAVAPIVPSDVRPGRKRRRRAANPGLWLALAWLLLMLAVAVGAPAIAPYDPVAQDAELVMAPASPAHLLGTDDLGRDVFSRLVAGTRPALLGMVVAMATAAVLGVPWGLASGYAGGWLDLAMMRVTDAVLIFPGLVLALVLTATLGAGLFTSMISLGIVYAPLIARVVRAEVLSVRVMDYVVLTRMFGASSAWRIFRHVLPNVLPAVVVQVTLLSGLSLLAETGLNFLGIGVPSPAPSWGASVAETFRYVVVDPEAPLIPGAVVVATVLSICAVGDFVRDRLRPSRS